MTEAGTLTRREAEARDQLQRIATKLGGLQRDEDKALGGCLLSLLGAYAGNNIFGALQVLGAFSEKEITRLTELQRARTAH